MGRYFRTIYLYIVSFITLCMVVVGFVGAVDSIAAYNYPTVSEYEIEDVYDSSYKEDVDIAVRINDLAKVERRASLKATFTYLAVLVCGTPLYVFHVKQIKKESEKEV